MSVSAHAATATSDLIPGPPSDSWEIDADGTGARTAADVYGTRASSVIGFVDSYQKTWTLPGLGLYQGLDHFSSVFWAAFRLGESKGATQRNKAHSSYRSVTGFGAAAYEYTDPAGADGYKTDTLVFTAGDYIAVITLAAYDSTPDHNVLMAQAHRQLDRIPVPIGEYNAIGSGLMTTFGWIGVVVAANVLVGGIIVAIVLVRSHRRRAATPLAPAWLNLSGDRRHWWDGQHWIDASFQSPPSAQRSADGAFWWDGATWRSVPQTNQPPASGR